MATSKQVRANRRNALSSTGPKTRGGKQAVRWNALKHGLLAREVVIGVGDGKENQREFQWLLEQLRTDFQPQGILEEVLVERVAVSYWRLRRVLRCEVGEIRVHLDAAIRNQLVATADEYNREKRFAAIDPERRLQRTSLGTKHLIAIIEAVAEDVRRAGNLTEESKKTLFDTFGFEEGGIASRCLLFHIMATEGPEKAKVDPEHYGDTPSPDVCNKIILEILQEENERLNQLHEEFTEIETLRLRARVMGFSLPSADASDRILRYEAAIERQLYRAIAQLERLQRQRRGEPVPPPISVDLGSGT